MENHAEIWFSDVQTDNVKLNIRLDKQLFSAISEYQRIDVFQSPAFGRFVRGGVVAKRLVDELGTQVAAADADRDHRGEGFARAALVWEKGRRFLQRTLRNEHAPRTRECAHGPRRPPEPRSCHPRRPPRPPWHGEPCAAPPGSR